MVSRFEDRAYSTNNKLNLSSRPSGPNYGGAKNNNSMTAFNPMAHSQQIKQTPAYQGSSTVRLTQQNNNLSHLSRQSAGNALHNSRIQGSQFFFVANEQDGHDIDVKKDMMRNTY